MASTWHHGTLCQDFNNSNSIVGTVPWDVKIRQAFEKSPSCAHAIADVSFFSGSECNLLVLLGQLANMTLGSVDLCTQAAPPFVLPMMLPGVWGYVEGEEFSPKHPIGG